MEKGTTCWLADGRKAEFAGEIDGQKFVRLVRGFDDCEMGYYEELDDRLLSVAQVFSVEPEDVFGPRTIAAQERLSKLQIEETALRESIKSQKNAKEEIERVAKVYPDIGLALDFLEGRIVYMIDLKAWAGPKVMSLAEALEEIDSSRREPGMKMLAMFGKQKSIHWSINRYSDGSGCWTEMVPARNTDEVRKIIADAAAADVSAWRNSGNNLHVLKRYMNGTYAVTMPDDVLAAIAAQDAENKAKRIAEAEKKLEEAKCA